MTANITCLRCRFRHPPDVTCQDAKNLADQVQHPIVDIIDIAISAMGKTAIQDKP